MIALVLKAGFDSRHGIPGLNRNIKQRKVNHMKFKIVMRDGTIIYANDICMYAVLQRVGIWACFQEIEQIKLSAVYAIEALFPDEDVTIFV